MRYLKEHLASHQERDGSHYAPRQLEDLYTLADGVLTIELPPVSWTAFALN